MQDLNKDEHQEQQGQQQQGSEKGSDVDIVMKEKEELLIKQGEKINALQVILSLVVQFWKLSQLCAVVLWNNTHLQKSAHTLLLAHDS